MYLCAYELDLDINELKEELIKLDNEWLDIDQHLKDQTGCYTCINAQTKEPLNDGKIYYVSVEFCKQLGYNSIFPFIEYFNDSFLIMIRFVTLRAGQYLGYHIDSDKSPEGYYSQEVPDHVVNNAQVNILLSNPVNEITYFAYDMKLTKYSMYTGGKYVPQSYRHHNEDGFKVIDSFVLQKKPAIINTSVWHGVQPSPEQDRIVASFTFWPLIPYDNVVEFCQQKGILIER